LLLAIAIRQRSKKGNTANDEAYHAPKHRCSITHGIKR